MASPKITAEIIGELETRAASIRFAELLKICVEYFGEPRIRGSHHIFKTPWPGDPRLNLQKDVPGARPYQVKQVAKALRRLNETFDT